MLLNGTEIFFFIAGMLTPYQKELFLVHMVELKIFSD